MTSHRQVELHQAFVWDCDECGRENFCRAVVAEFSEEQKAEVAEDWDLSPEELRTGLWMTRPDEVTCTHCGTTFEAKDVGEETE